MTRKRAQPDKNRRKPKRRKTLTRRILRIVAAVIARHPSVAGGTVAFAVIFGFVAANAIWYQPGAHPDPIFRTRERLAGMAKAQTTGSVEVARAMTVSDVIEGDTASGGASGVPDAGQTGSIPVPAAAAPKPAAGSGDLIHDIQAGLAAHHFYAGPVDGKNSAGTRAAIEAFQAATASRLTGEPSVDLLRKIQATHRAAVAIPRSRPGNVPAAGDDEIATILTSAAPADVPTPKPVPAIARKASKGPHGLVERIQTGLRNIAYSNVTVDGIAGNKTRHAILNFEKNYRLPQTGKPSRAVLNKLIAIGAL